MFKVFKTSIDIGYYGLAFMHGLIFAALLLTCFLIYGEINTSNFANLKESQINYIADVLFYFLCLTLFVGSLIPIEYANTKRGIMKVYYEEIDSTPAKQALISKIYELKNREVLHYADYKYLSRAQFNKICDLVSQYSIATKAKEKLKKQSTFGKKNSTIQRDNELKKQIRQMPVL
jgi:hypothetical protein